MMIVCPSCATSYMIDPGSLGPAGRMVRCARCKTAWFAGGPKARADVAGFVENVIAEAEGRPPTTPRPPLREEIAAPDDFGSDDAPQQMPAAPFGKRTEPVTPFEEPHVEPPTFESMPVAEAPALVPLGAHDEPPAARRARPRRY